jgi:hypothetical protein
VSIARLVRELPWPEWPTCPCGCGTEGLKLQTRHDKHLVGCVCRVCLGRRSQKKGRRAQHRAHKILGGHGFSPFNEESGRTYSVEVQIEAKAGAQIPAAFSKFVGLDWTRRALQQAASGTPEGVVAFPAVYLEPEGGGQWLLVDLR